MRLTLVRVRFDNTAARIRIGDNGYRVEPDGTFADDWVLVSLRDGTCATFRHGSAHADLCEGESIEVS